MSEKGVLLIERCKRGREGCVLEVGRLSNIISVVLIALITLTVIDRIVDRVIWCLFARF